MTYACDDCGFLFFRIAEVRECPLCGGARVRPATEEEKKALNTNLKKQTRTETNFGRK